MSLLSLVGCQLALTEAGLVTTQPPLPASTAVEPEATTVADSPLPWWNERVFYEIFVRSFQDSDGDGKGDFQGLISRLDYLNDGDPTTTTDLGITGIWLMPILESPSYHGYDVIDYRTIERDYGSNDDFQQFLAEAHKRGIKVIVDLVTNHTSNRHPWFQAAQQTDAVERDWYLWRDERPDYRGPWDQVVWHRGGQAYYYGIFWQGMPDLNYEHPAVTAEMYEIARFWLTEMGVDGFRLDAIKHLIEDGKRQENTAATHTWLQAFHAHVRTVSPNALLVGEIWSPTTQVAQYVGDEVDIAFEFDLASAILGAVQAQSKTKLERAQRQIQAAYSPGQYAAFLTNHDQDRLLSQLRNDIEANKLAATLLLTNPGVPFLYYGEEIGMVGRKPDERIRTPMQWDATEDTAGFTTGKPWQRLSSTYRESNVALELQAPDSLLHHYRTLIHLRLAHPALRYGEFWPVETDQRGLYSFIRYLPEETLLVMVNLSQYPLEDYQLTLAESPLSAIEATEVLFGTGQPQPLQLDAGGGFAAYQPLPLAGRSSVIIQLAKPY